MEKDLQRLVAEVGRKQRALKAAIEEGKKVLAKARQTSADEALAPRSDQETSGPAEG